jgi:hypothetical protein
MHGSPSRALVGSLVFLATALHGAALHGGSSSQATNAPGTQAQTAAPAQSAPHIYRISAFRAAPGKFRELEKLLTATPSPGAGANDGDLAVVFRHRQGNEWDFLTVEHMGPQATISAGNTPPQPDSPFSQVVAWHGDTYVAGPPLDEFRKALNLSGTSAPSGVYSIGDYMAAAGHRGALRQALDKIAAETPGRSVLFSHVEGAPWNFMTIQRYDSWQQVAADEDKAMAQSKGDASADPGVQMRDHLAVHHDTYATIDAVVVAGAR